MAGVQRLNRGGKIRRKKKKANLMNDEWIHSAVMLQSRPYSSGSCTTATEFVCYVSHCSDNVTHPLRQNDDDRSSTDKYELDDIDDKTRSPVPVSSNTTASATEERRGRPYQQVKWKLISQCKCDCNTELETVSIAEPLQKRQHARETPNAVNTKRERE